MENGLPREWYTLCEINKLYEIKSLNEVIECAKKAKVSAPQGCREDHKLAAAEDAPPPDGNEGAKASTRVEREEEQPTCI